MASHRFVASMDTYVRLKHLEPSLCELEQQSYKVSSSVFHCSNTSNAYNRCKWNGEIDTKAGITLHIHVVENENTG